MTRLPHRFSLRRAIPRWLIGLLFVWLPTLLLAGERLDASGAEVIHLQALSEDEQERQRALENNSGRFLIGFGRQPNPALNSWPTTGCWQRLQDDRQRCVLALQSPSAKGLRLGLRVAALPDSAQLGFQGVADPAITVASAADIHASLDTNQNQAMGGSGHLYWSPITQGDAMTLEVVLPTGVDPEEIKLSVPVVSHLFRLPWMDDAGSEDERSSCHQDIACDNDLDQLSRSIALLLFTESDGDTGGCTGTLVADADPTTEIQALLTAHHCISDQAAASSVETLWFHRKVNCSGLPEEPLRLGGGADLVQAFKTADSSLLRLRQPAPEGSAFVRWSTALPFEGEPVISIHHPHGKPQKIARGRLKDYLHCEDAAYCGDDADPDGTHYLSVTWTAGVTESGSSGAGLFLASTGELIGVLSGGLSGCDTPDGVDDYGWIGYWGHSSIVGGLDQQR